jgi:hypothetical protein
MKYLLFVLLICNIFSVKAQKTKEKKLDSFEMFKNYLIGRCIDTFLKKFTPVGTDSVRVREKDSALEYLKSNKLNEPVGPIILEGKFSSLGSTKDLVQCLSNVKYDADSHDSFMLKNSFLACIYKSGGLIKSKLDSVTIDYIFLAFYPKKYNFSWIDFFHSKKQLAFDTNNITLNKTPPSIPTTSTTDYILYPLLVGVLIVGSLGWIFFFKEKNKRKEKTKQIESEKMEFVNQLNIANARIEKLEQSKLPDYKKNETPKVDSSYVETFEKATPKTEKINSIDNTNDTLRAAKNTYYKLPRADKRLLREDMVSDAVNDQAFFESIYQGGKQYKFSVISGQSKSFYEKYANRNQHDKLIRVCEVQNSYNDFNTIIRTITPGIGTLDTETGEMTITTKAVIRYE